ncbi:MAG: hypothetical protein IPM56_04710 [Ignavibacteriales bacterium]|nr:MAG: hypothetical protein IPM56_04710 [Ignavibacteriales bacterium]
MDNVFEILIYAFIIISFLSSFFKKKTKEQPKTTGTFDNEESVSVTTYKGTPVKAEKKEVDDYDILREIEKMFKTETAESPERVPQRVEPIKQAPQSVLKTDTKKVASEHSATLSEHVFSKSISYDDANYRSKLKPKSAQQTEKYFPTKKENKKVLTDLRRKLRDPSSLRDFVIISEILGKPKALRR